MSRKISEQIIREQFPMVGVEEAATIAGAVVDPEYFSLHTAAV